ncbi:hypothetical protein BKA70DRAFT_1309949 [Coprinopsis sp. MPI-PUGE-AT-0042]|nr:hypothetical protein BKA70DRAFT_1309949 [Coprinopsis sp. MPI-PUGE-AT-0042]
MRVLFAHNSLASLREVLSPLERRGEFRQGKASIFVSVDYLYGTFAPLLEIPQMIEEVFPLGNA